MTQNEKVLVTTQLDVVVSLQKWDVSAKFRTQNVPFLLIPNRTGQRWFQSGGCLCIKQPNKISKTRVKAVKMVRGKEHLSY